MLPRIEPEFTISANYRAFIKDIDPAVFSGEIKTDYATRLSMAVDNSIYQVIPQAVIFPRKTEDIAALLKLAHQDKYHDIQFCARGGGTSTNGQSLTAGIIIDCSKYMRDIIELNLDLGWVRVQPGVILDQLNSALKQFGVSFAPEISPSNRATIGGMINTDACGTGSRVLGRTSDHIVELTCVLNDGRVINTAQMDASDQLYVEVEKLISPHKKLIDEKFSSAPRTLNGYNLKKAWNNKLSLNYLFCGSEGTLGVVSECKLKLTPLPKFKKIFVVKYSSFDDALRAVEITEQFKPLAIEAIDEKLIDLARQDSIYFYIKDFIEDAFIPTRAINIIEFVSQDEASLEKIATDFSRTIEKNKNLPGHATGFYLAKNAAEEKVIWELRKKSVGLISKKTDVTRRPIPFVEDTAVPPEKLADYIVEFKALLDSYQLMYGMYGHVDAGCVHVRPALDMKIVHDEKLIRELTDKVVLLIEKYNGVLWGEHGHGYRSNYGERFFGKELYHVVCQIKTLFDPYNQLNPGKIATAIDTTQELVNIEGPLRGKQDKQIPENMREQFAATIACNGNGACFNYASAEVMCPSYKVTRDRVQSPKGRATVMREWLRQLANKKFTLNPMKSSSFFQKIFTSRKKQNDFSHEVYTAMSGCLSCKACAGQCPLNVDVPEFKAKFLSVYYQRYFRPLRDHLVASLESIAPKLALFPNFSNALLCNRFSQFIIRKTIGLVDLPKVTETSINAELKKRKAPEFNFNELMPLSADQKSRSVILLQDTFTSYYEPQVLLSIYDILTRLGFTVYVAPFFANGKPLHALGFLKEFSRLVEKNTKRLHEFFQLNIPLVGIDPSITLTYRDEYQKINNMQGFTVKLLQEWLVEVQEKFLSLSVNAGAKKKIFYLLSHCTEKTACIETDKWWQTIYLHFGLTLQSLPAGCCGMAGVYGHEEEHVKNSKALFDMDWKRILAENPGTVLATGYSCRSQAARFMNAKLQHPLELLANLLT